MTQEDLQEAVNRRPFSPFRMLISTGITFDVRHPEQVVVQRRAVVVVVTQEQNGVPIHRSVTVDLLHVVAVELLPTVDSSTNGHP